MDHRTKLNVQPTPTKGPGKILKDLLYLLIGLLVFLWEVLRRIFNRSPQKPEPSDNGLRRITPLPAAPRRRIAFATATAPFADRARFPVMLKALGALLATRRATVRFSNHTGLVRSLRGELYPEQSAVNPAAMRELAGAFLSRYGTALHGAVEGYRYHAETDPGIPSRVVLRQTDRNGIPVYGGNMVFGFSDAGELGIIFNGWYPLDPKLEYTSEFRVSWEHAGEIAQAYVKEYFASSHHLSVTPGDTLKHGLVIFPWEDEGRNNRGANFRPAWIVFVNEQDGPQGWKIIVDAETARILAAEDATVGAIQTNVYANNTDASNNNPTIKDLGVEQLANAPDFGLGGTEFQEPLPVSEEGFRSANVYYHLHLALTIFEQIATAAWPAGLLANLNMPGRGKRVPVSMDPFFAKIAEFKYGDDSLHIGKAGRLDPFSIGDPARDCQVIYHEYTHAVLAVVQPDLYSMGRFMGAINEGTAFYFGCTLSERQDPTGDPSHWGTVAFKDFGERRVLKHENGQAAGFDYLPIYGVFPRYPIPDPAGEKYGSGMVWARALWDIRRLLGYSTSDPIILRGLSLEGGIQSEMETPAEAIIHVDGEYPQGGPSHENALRLVFCSRGIMADAPVHALLSGKRGGTSYLIAASENMASNNQTLGCVISVDNGDSWTPLGTGGPSQVAALASAKGNNTTVLWAANETWDEVNRQVKTDVYRYDLPGNGDLTTPHPWQSLGSLPNSVLSLAATWDAQLNQLLLFAGTEDGLFKYDGHWGAARLAGEPIYSLAIQNVPACLVVGTQNGIRLLNLANLSTLPDEYLGTGLPIGSQLVLRIVPDPNGEGHLWAGTAFDGIFHFDPTLHDWLPNDFSTVDSPVYDLLPEKDGPGWTLYAGTGKGVWQQTNGAVWNAYNTTGAAAAEQIEGTSVVSLCRTDQHIFAGTAQRGIWRNDADVWKRSITGLPRIGRLVDAVASTAAQTFTQHLPPFGVGMHVIYVPQHLNSLSFMLDTQHAKLALYFVPPQIDPNSGRGAGLKDLQLGNGLVNGIEAGFYVLSVTSNTNTGLDYTVTFTGA